MVALNQAIASRNNTKDIIHNNDRWVKFLKEQWYGVNDVGLTKLEWMVLRA